MMTTEEQKAYLGHMENARRTYAAMKPEDMDALQGHGMTLERHVNQMVRNGGAPSVQGYMDSLTAAHQKDVDSVKTQAAKDRKIQAHAALMDHITKNQKAFGKSLELHGHLTNATHVLNGVMAKNSPFMHTVNGEATGPEGAVVVDKQGNSSKIIDRGPEGFAAKNLTGMGKIAQSGDYCRDDAAGRVGTYWPLLVYDCPYAHYNAHKPLLNSPRNHPLRENGESHDQWLIVHLGRDSIDRCDGLVREYYDGLKEFPCREHGHIA